MDATSCIVTLTAAGGALQVAGLSLVVKEVRKDREAAASLIAPTTQEIRPGSIGSEENVPAPSVGGEHKASLEDRVDSLEMQLDAKFRMVQATTHATRAEIQQLIAQEANALARQDKERDHALRSFLRTQITGGLRDRILGVTLIGIGIVAATAGGVWGTIASSG